MIGRKRERECLRVDDVPAKKGQHEKTHEGDEKIADVPVEDVEFSHQHGVESLEAR